MITVGVTGAIGSGKTIVCSELEKLGAKVIYADDLAKELMVKDKELRNALISKFGKDTYHPDGTLNRPHLIREAFGKGRVEDLNSLVHPVVAKIFRQLCTEAERAGERMVVEEAALLLNNGRPQGLDVVVIVKSKREDRVKRVIERDHVIEENVLSRDAEQPDFDKLNHLADYIIENDGTLEELKEKTERLFNTLIEIHNL